MKLIDYRTKNFDYILTVEEGWIWTSQRQYVGSCTVWHTYPEFRLVSLQKQLLLHGLWKKIQHEKD